ncbi:MAG: hypothetical protein FWB76_03715 [Oscillospiraceae bacterium]|nr:hypothetical protein [Oscillospiraceae bacterium]
MPSKKASAIGATLVGRAIGAPWFFRRHKNPGRICIRPYRLRVVQAASKITFLSHARRVPAPSRGRS